MRSRHWRAEEIHFVATTKHAESQGEPFRENLQRIIYDTKGPTGAKGEGNKKSQQPHWNSIKRLRGAAWKFERSEDQGKEDEEEEEEEQVDEEGPLYSPTSAAPSPFRELLYSPNSEAASSVTSGEESFGVGDGSKATRRAKRMAMPDLDICNLDAREVLSLWPSLSTPSSAEVGSAGVGAAASSSSTGAGISAPSSSSGSGGVAAAVLPFPPSPLTQNLTYRLTDAIDKRGAIKVGCSDVYLIDQDTGVQYSKPIGQIQPFRQDVYPLGTAGAAQCYLPGHIRCSRTRVPRDSDADDPDAVSDSMLQWLLTGLKDPDCKTRADHMKLPRT